MNLSTAYKEKVRSISSPKTVKQTPGRDGVV